MKLPHSAISAINRARFIYAPPRFEELNPHLQWAVKPPYPDAPGWQCSVYYYWYEYLRRHEGYKETCLNLGAGPFGEQFLTFGNVHGLNFAEWWAERFWLFEEKRPVRRLKKVPLSDARGFPFDRDTLYLEVDLTAPPSQLFRELRAEIWSQRTASEERASRASAERAAKRDRQAPPIKIELKKSTAHFPVETKPVLSAFHEHLLVWDARTSHTNVDDADIADIAGIRVNQIVDGETLVTRTALKLSTSAIEKVLQRRKQLAVQRHIRIARQYIDNVMLGKFPLRSKR